MQRTVLVMLSLVLLALNFIPFTIDNPPVYNRRELFDTSLLRLNSIDKFCNHLDSIATQNQIPTHSVKYAVLTEGLIKNRFYHGFCHYALKQNWIASISGKTVGYGLSSIVNPEDIITQPYAACSQQAIVMMEVMKRKGFSYRSVGFPHHYALEFLINGNWYYFDPNMEPDIPDSCRLESKWDCFADNLKKYYDPKKFTDLDWKFGNALPLTFGKVNAPPAPNASLFQNSTFYLSKVLWIFPMIVAFYPRKRRFRSRYR